MNYFRILTKLFVAGGLLTLLASAQAAIPAVPPEILAQLQNMSPAEQRALARQYGFDLDQVLGGGIGAVDVDGQRPTLGAPGERLEQVELDDQEKEDVREPSEEEELQRFGSNLFDSEVSTFAPVDNIPVPEGYRLGVGDQISIMLIGQEQGQYLPIIGRNGAIAIPRVGALELLGLSFPDAQRLIEAKVAEQFIGTTAIISLGRLRNINVFMSGEVKRPGSYSVSALARLTQTLYLAGGISDIGSYRNIQLKRSGQTVKVFDVYDLLLFGDNSGDAPLRNGDVVFVPVAGPQVQVRGAVARPAIYEFLPGETIDSLVNMSGGLLSSGYEKQAQLKRFRSAESMSSIINIDLSATDLEKEELYDGDELFVRSKPSRAANPVLVKGATDLQGLFGWNAGLRISDIFTDLEADLQPDADLEMALLLRRAKRSNEISVRGFSIAEALSDPSSDSNHYLEPFDEIIVLPLVRNNNDSSEDVEQNLDASTQQQAFEDARSTDIFMSSDGIETGLRRSLIQPLVERLKRQARYGAAASVVSIQGAVQMPGELPLLNDATVEQTIALAGGYIDGAHLSSAEIRRVNLNERQEVEVGLFSLDLLDKANEKFRLKSRDTLKINEVPNWSVDNKINVGGEVVFPGEYIIFEGERISNVIERAGGLTRDAFVQGAQFRSATAKLAQEKQFKKISEKLRRRFASREAATTGSLGFAADEDRTSASVDTSEVITSISSQELGRVVIDLEAALEGESKADLVVENGDSIFIPKFNNTISVVGEVYEPGTFIFDEKITGVKAYVKLAGGETDFAIAKKTYVLKANGSVKHARGNLFKSFTQFGQSDENVIQPGDVIVVPTDLNYMPRLQRTSAITNVVFQSLTSVAAFLSLGNR